jgi:hypothetical protein
MDVYYYSFQLNDIDAYAYSINSANFVFSLIFLHSHIDILVQAYIVRSERDFQKAIFRELDVVF